MKSKIFLGIGITLLLSIIIFIIYAFNHPEKSFSFGTSISTPIYLIWITSSIVMFILSFIYKNK